MPIQWRSPTNGRVKWLDNFFIPDGSAGLVRYPRNHMIAPGIMDSAPTAEEGLRGALAYVPGAAGVTDAWKVVHKTIADAYETRSFVTTVAGGITPVYNLADYCVLDGVTDDTTGALAAIAAAAAAGGGIVFHPGGTLLTSTGITWSSNYITLMGAGRYTSKVKLGSGGTHALEFGGTGSRVCDLEINGNKAGGGVGHGIRCYGVEHLVENCYIHDTDGYGIGAGQQSGETLQNCVFRDLIIRNAGDDGIDFKDMSSTNLTNYVLNVTVDTFDYDAGTSNAGIDMRGPVVVSNVNVKGGSSNGACVRWRQSGASGRAADGCSLTNAILVPDTGAVAISISADYARVANVDVVGGGRSVTVGGIGASLTNVSVRGSDDRAFYVTGTNATFVNCQVDAADNDGFYIAGNDTRLIGCEARDCDSQSIYVVAVDRTKILGCHVIQAVGTAIQIDASSDDTHVAHTDLSQVSSTKMTNNGTATTFADNPGYVTRNASVTSVADGGTITHGLVGTPTKYGATTTTADEFLSITAVSSTTLTIALTKHDGTAGTTANVAWWAEI